MINSCERQIRNSYDFCLALPAVGNRLLYEIYKIVILPSCLFISLSLCLFYRSMKTQFRFGGRKQFDDFIRTVSIKQIECGPKRDIQSVI